VRLDEKKLSEIRTWVQARVGKGRFAHILGVEKASLRLAQRYQLPAISLRAAALLHDCAKEMGRPQMRALFRKGPFQLDEGEKVLPALWHPHAGANLAYHHWKIRHPSILDAIRCHTLGRPGMGKMAQALFVADYIEAGRRFKGLRQARQAAQKSLAEGVRVKAAQTIEYLLSEGRKVHPRLVETWNAFTGPRP
jgi:predicted HD superfamily hydrolase involved in NAD metabolism